MITFSWERRIRRAEDLLNDARGGSEFLRFYLHVARFQSALFEQLQAIDQGRALLAAEFPAFLNLVIQVGPTLVADRARAILAGAKSFEEVCAEQEPFFARALLQPYFEATAARSTAPIPTGEIATCAYCSEKPQVGVLRGEGEGARRALICSMCSNEWNFRRLVCPGCGEERNDRLPVFTASDFPHARVEACDTCRCYLKTIDMTRDGLAVPVVDEIATVALDLWIAERGYQKLQPNLLML
jgi:FdhE protein